MEMSTRDTITDRKIIPREMTISGITKFRAASFPSMFRHATAIRSPIQQHSAVVSVSLRFTKTTEIRIGSRNAVSVIENT